MTAIDEEREVETPDGSAPRIGTTRLVLVRHAVTPETGPILTGRSPGVDLSTEGRTQAAALAERLREAELHAIYASPMERTMQTAQPLARLHGLEISRLDGVVEADYGEWTGGALAELAKLDEWTTVQRAPSRARFPGGESLAAMQARVIAALDEVIAAHPNETVLVVSHADPIKAAIAHYTGIHLDLFQRIVVAPASLTIFEIAGHGVTLLKSNDTGALDELRARRAAPEGSEDDA